VNIKRSALGIALLVSAVCLCMAEGNSLVPGIVGLEHAPDDTLQAIPTNIMESVADWLAENQGASLEQVTEQANAYLRRFGWPFTFDIGNGHYPGNEEVLAALSPGPPFRPDSDDRIAPFYVSASDSVTIAFRIEIPQTGLHITGNGSVDVPIAGIRGRTIDLVANAGLIQLVLPPTFLFGELRILDAAFTRVIGTWPIEFNEDPPRGISRDASKVYFCMRLLKTRENSKQAITTRDWWRESGGVLYSTRIFGHEYREPFLILALSREGTFAFESTYEEISEQKVEWIQDPPISDGNVYWRFVFDDGLVYVMGWPGIIS
jgi:hypothetical protein